MAHLFPHTPSYKNCHLSFVITIDFSLNFFCKIYYSFLAEIFAYLADFHYLCSVIKRGGCSGLAKRCQRADKTKSTG